jgi:L-alanine-DL-glutamate epimerase-like enolase superfamily enzyme
MIGSAARPAPQPEPRSAARALPGADSLDVTACTVPAERRESDGTLEWDATTIVVTEARAGDVTGLGYTYGHPAVAEIIRRTLAPIVTSRRGLDVRRCWREMVSAVRNVGLPGVAACAISAVDAALWDLRARMLGLPLAAALGAVHEDVPLYGSGGFTSYSEGELSEQLSGWAADGFGAVKMKVGREPVLDVGRTAAARRAVGDGVSLMVDANGAYTQEQARSLATRFADQGVIWFEEPVSSDDLAGLARLRTAVPPGLEIAAGEYGYTPWYFARMLQAGAVGCLQADVTRCLGITGFLEVAALCSAHGVDLSAHCAPQLSAHACAAVRRLRHLEYFHDHVRIETMLFDGCLRAAGGVIRPGEAGLGNGLAFRREVADRYRTA